jgi:hypothetical protein
MGVSNSRLKPANQEKPKRPNQRKNKRKQVKQQQPTNQSNQIENKAK